jgi:hypothetical protein
MPVRLSGDVNRVQVLDITGLFWYEVQLLKGGIIRLCGVAECNHRKATERGF